MFNKDIFKIFEIPDIENRMKSIKSDIQPIFKSIWDSIIIDISKYIDRDMNIHIAQHIRRIKNPPDSTWSAISTKKKGYKSEPHFQIGIWKQYTFIYLSMIDNPKNEKEIANLIIDNINIIKSLPDDFVYSTDHTKKEYYILKKEIKNKNLEKDLIRFRDIKKSEFEIGRIIGSNSDLLNNYESYINYIKSTIIELLPLYKIISVYI